MLGCVSRDLSFGLLKYILFIGAISRFVGFNFVVRETKEYKYNVFA
jgi:hypothetical protein